MSHINSNLALKKFHERFGNKTSKTIGFLKDFMIIHLKLMFSTTKKGSDLKYLNTVLPFRLYNVA